MARAYSMDAATVHECRGAYKTLTAQLQPAVLALYEFPLEEGSRLASHQQEVFMALARFERRRRAVSGRRRPRLTEGPVQGSDLLTMSHAKDAYRQRIALGPSSITAQHSLSFYDAVASLLRIYLDEEKQLSLDQGPRWSSEAAAKRTEWMELLSSAILAQDGVQTAAQLLQQQNPQPQSAASVIEAQKCATLALFYACVKQQTDATVGCHWMRYCRRRLQQKCWSLPYGSCLCLGHGIRRCRSPLPAHRPRCRTP